MKLSASALDTFQTCPKLYEYKYVNRIRTPESEAQLVGLAFHKFMETWDPESNSYVCDLTNEPTAVALGCYMGYASRWSQTPIKRWETEKKFELTFREHTVTGRIDGIWEIDGKLCVVEHKTTSMNLGTFAHMRVFDRQTVLYPLAAKAFGYDVDAVLLDMVQVPRWRPRRGALDLDAIVERVHQEALYDRRYLYKTSKDTEDFLNDLDGVSRQMELGVFPRNPTACFKYNKMCDFYQECCNGLSRNEG